MQSEELALEATSRIMKAIEEEVDSGNFSCACVALACVAGAHLAVDHRDMDDDHATEHVAGIAGLALEVRKRFQAALSQKPVVLQ